MWTKRKSLFMGPSRNLLNSYAGTMQSEPPINNREALRYLYILFFRTSKGEQDDN
jgi:hypothetical protein